MQLTCPCCAARYPLEAALNDDAARRAIGAAVTLPGKLGPLVLRYAGLWRPDKHQLRWDRAARIITELATVITAGRIQRKGRSWTVNTDQWQQALEQTLSNAAAGKLQRPLKTHGYLYEVALGLADKTEAVIEQKTIDKHKARPRKPTADTDKPRTSKAAAAAAVAKLRKAASGQPITEETSP